MGGNKSKEKKGVDSPRGERKGKDSPSNNSKRNITEDTSNEDAPRIFKEVGDSSESGKKGSTRERKKLLKLLEDKGLERWSVEDTGSYIYLSCGHFLRNKGDKGSCPDGLIQTLDRLKIDGDGLLFIGEEFFSQVLKSVKPEEVDTMKEFFKVMQKIQQDELGKLRRLVIPSPDPKNMFPAYDLPKSGIQLILFYHNATKHSAKAKSRTVSKEPSIQPHSWRRYYGAPHYSLPIPKSGGDTKDITYNEIYVSSAIESKNFDLASLSELFFYSVALSARLPLKNILEEPKNAWAKRVNASSCGIHTTEIYAILPAMEGLDKEKAGVYHYDLKNHGLERRFTFSSEQWDDLVGTLPEDAFFIGISTIPWRAIWKNGERGFRDAQIDIGSALASIRMASAILGWRISVLTGISDESLSSLFGTNTIKNAEEEKEYPTILAAVVPTYHIPTKKFSVDSGLIQQMKKQTNFHGVPNSLTLEKHVRWELVNQIIQLTYSGKSDKSSTLFPPSKMSSFVSLPQNFFKDSIGVRATQTLRMRRSATEFYPGPITLSQFGQFLGRISPYTSLVPWDVASSEDWGINVNLLFFVYRVENLPSGYYIMMRSKDTRTLDNLKKTNAHCNFRWNLSPKIPSELAFYFLKEDDSETVAKAAAAASGNPDLILNSAFSCCIFADLQDVLDQKRQDCSFYRNLYWECGMMNQTLYNEAFAVGVHAIGMNSFIDELIKPHFGLEKSSQEFFFFFSAGKANPVEEYVHIPYAYQKEMFNVVDD